METQGRSKKQDALESDPLLPSEPNGSPLPIHPVRSSIPIGQGSDYVVMESSSRLSGHGEAAQNSDTASQRWHRIALILNSGSAFTDVLKLITLNSRQKALSHTGVGQAAFLIRDAFLEGPENPADGAYDPYIDPNRLFRNAMAVICGRICSSRPVLQIINGTAWVLLLLSFIEPPSWCHHSHYSHASHIQGCEAFLSVKGAPATTDNVTYPGDKVGNSTEEVQYYPNSHSMILTSHQSCLVEAIGLGVIVAVILVRLGRDGMDIGTYLRPGPSQLNRIAQIACIVGMVASLYRDYRLFLPYLRLGLLSSFLRGTKQNIKVLFQMLPEVWNVLALLGLFMIFYAWFGCVMFVGTSLGQMHFSSFIESIWTLWICVTTANYPDVMMPLFNENRWVALYFISFMVISFFFLMNVILAGVVNRYDTAMTQRKGEMIARANENLRRAFALMDPDGRGFIDRETVMGLFLILNEDFPEFRTLSEEDTTLLFAVLDKDGTNIISEAEFMDFGNVILLEFTRTSDNTTFIEKYFPRVFATTGYQRFCEVIKSTYFEAVIDIVLVLNAIVIGIQSYPELSGNTVDIDPKNWDGSIDTPWEVAEAIFTGIYAVEVMVKLTVYGWKRYMETTKNLFDFTVTILAIASSAIVYFPNAINDSRIIRMIVMLRVLRLIRLLTSMKRFQLIGAVSAEILPAARNVFLILFLLMYLFAVIGVSIFGGLISRDPQNKLSYLVLGTEYAESEYWGNNFNDMLSAMNVLFNLLVGNNWTVMEIGIEGATQSKWVRVYFMAFHILGVILVNNLVIAFIIDQFLSQLAAYREKSEEEVVGEGEAVIYQRRAKFRGSQVTGTETGIHGDYIARIRYDAGEGHAHDRLRHFFTQTSSNEGLQNKTTTQTEVVHQDSGNQKKD